MSSEHTPAQGPITVTTDQGQSPIVVTETQAPVDSPIVLDNPAAPIVDPVTPAPIVDPATTPAPDDTAKKKYESDALQRRINELTAKRFEAERVARMETDARIKAEQANADLIAKLGGKVVDPAVTVMPAMNEAEIDRRAQEKAVQMAENARFNDQCNNIAESGKKDFPDWDDALRNLTMVGAVGQNVDPEFLRTAVELRSPHKILHYLGKNLEEAERVTKLPPKQMAMEMARLEASLNAPAPAIAPIIAPLQVSNAPAPVIPVGGKSVPGATDLADPNTSMDDFMMTRYKQLEARRNRYQRA